MLSNYTFSRYCDNFLLGNTDTTTSLTYSLTIQVNCGSYLPVVGGAGTIAPIGSIILPLPVRDGDYQLTLTGDGGSIVIPFRNYINLQSSLISNLQQVLCGQNTCPDCSAQGLDDCVNYQAVFAQIIGYQYIIRPYSPDYCLNGDLIDSFIHQAIELNKCNLYSQFNSQLIYESMYGRIASSKQIVLYIATIYYLVFYYYERLLAVDANEQAYVDAKFYWGQVQNCITNIGMNLSSLSTLFISVTNENNLPPSVGNVIRHITYSSGLQTYTFSQADFTNNFSDPQGNNPNQVMILNNVFNGELYYQGVLINGAGFTFTISNSNQLTYQYTPIETNHIYDIVYFQINDDNPTPKYSNMATFTIDVNAYVNQPPSAVGNNSITIGNRVDRVFTLADFTTNTTPPYADPESDGVYQLRIDTLPSLGTLKLSGSACTSSQIINASDIVAGNFVYDAPNQDAAAAVSFNFSLSDTGSHTFVS